MTRNLFLLQVRQLLAEVRRLTPDEWSHETPTVPAWRWGVESALMMVIVDNDYLTAYREGLAQAAVNAVSPTAIRSISFEALPVAEILQLGLMRPVLTDHKLAGLAVSEPALTKLHEVWDETLKERAIHPDEWVRRGCRSDIWDHVQFVWGHLAPEEPKDGNNPLDRITKAFLKRINSGSQR